MMLSKDLLQCIEEIAKIYTYDTVTLLDYVLTDDEEDPQFSANTVYRRILTAIEFRKLYYGVEISVNDFIAGSGNSDEDISLFYKKCNSEAKRYGWAPFEIENSQMNHSPEDSTRESEKSEEK